MIPAALVALAVALTGCATSEPPAEPESFALPSCGPAVVGVDEGQRAEGVREFFASSTGIEADSVTAVEITIERPELRNDDEVRRALQAHYPPLLRDAGISGSAEYSVLIGSDGRVAGTQVFRGARHPEFNEAGADVLAVMEFDPPVHDGCRLAVVVRLNVSFEVDARGA